MMIRSTEPNAPTELIKVMAQCDVCRLAFSLRDIPYIVPMNYGYEFRDGALTLYFHCGQRGKKLDILHQNPHVCFQMDGAHQLIVDESPCKYSMAYVCAIGSGSIAPLTDPGEKERALNLIMQRYTGKADFTFPEAQMRAVNLLALTVSEYSVKIS